MLTNIRATWLGAVLTIILSASFLPGQASADLEGVGSVDFPTSVEGEAQEHFLRGVATLHSFGWQQAAEQFQAAQQINPDFAMAYWGESLCYNHPLITEQDRDTPQKVLMKLGATPEARLEKAPTQREKGFLAAAEVLFFGDGDYGTRRTAYMGKMAELYEQFPADDEVAAFYALSLLSAAGPAGGEGLRLNIRAGAIAMQLFDRKPNHPGAAHYTIHAFDDPIHAPLALPAAYKFADIAPAVSHARHMPTHIFIQHGMWPEVSAHNQSAYDAAVALWKPGSFAGDMAHALDWGQYGDLQMGDVERAMVWQQKAEKMAVENTGQTRVASLPDNINARYIIETHTWETSVLSETASSALIFANGVSGLHLGQPEIVTQAIEILNDRANVEIKDTSYYSRTITPVKIMYQELIGLQALSQGNTADALASLDTAVDLALSMRPPNGAANPIKPAHELKGEVLVTLERYDEAIPVLTQSLRRTPGRAQSVLALARAYAGIGDETSAAERYAQLIDIRQRRDLPETREARAYLMSTSPAGS
jgi:tetratricopeptide (TPR) repeat protein